jgi:antitoxin VapB
VQYTFAIYIGFQAMAISTVFTNNRTQAVRLPAELRLPASVKKVEVRARGKDRIISPVGHRWDEFFLNGPPVSDDFLTDRGSQIQSDREEL